MKYAWVLFVGVLLVLTGPAMAVTVREIGASELRKIVSAGDTISLKAAVAAVAKSVQADPIEARAFEADGIFYRIVLKQADGTLISVIIDAKTGAQVKSGSAIGKEVSAAASEKGSKGKSATAGSNGKGGTGGSSGGNGGGNGGGKP
jgi:uncharacterized membrane protein YgcG